MAFLAESVVTGCCIVIRIAQLAVVKPILNSADNSYSIKTEVVNNCLKGRRTLYGLAHKGGIIGSDRFVCIQKAADGNIEVYTPVKQYEDLRVKLPSNRVVTIDQAERDPDIEGIHYATAGTDEVGKILKFVRFLQSPDRGVINRIVWSPLLWQWPKETDVHYATITTTRLGILAIQNAIYQQFVCLLLLVELFVISTSLHFGNPYIDPLHKLVKAVNIVTAISLVADSLVHTFIQQQLAGPIISNSLDSCLQRCGYYYSKIEEQAGDNQANNHQQADGHQQVNVGNQQANDQQQANIEWEIKMRKAKWHEIVWITNTLNPKRKEWSKNLQFGIQYCQAIDAADNAYAGFDIANKGQLAAMIAISSQILLFIIITSTGLGREKSLQIVSSGAVVAFSTAAAGGIATNAVNKFAASSAAKKARRLINAINGGFCSIDIGEILEDIFKAKSFTKRLLFAITAALIPHQSFSAVQPRKESTVGYCFSNDLELHDVQLFKGIIPKIQRTPVL